MNNKSSGSVAIVGRPNVGKSTLINALLKQKISIVSQRQQTTRTVVRALSDNSDEYIAWIDTPGWQKKHVGDFNRSLNLIAESAIDEADIIIFMMVADNWLKADDIFLARLPKDKPIIAVMNKIDRLDNKEILLPKMAELSQRANFVAIVPISAHKSMGLNALKKEINQYLNKHTPIKKIDQPEDDQYFYIAELVREKLFRHLGDELPYSIGVITENIEETPKLLKASLIIYIVKESHKSIVIGKGGSLLKTVGTAVRLELEKLLRKKVFFTLQVKVEDWKNKPALLNKMRIGRFL